MGKRSAHRAAVLEAYRALGAETLITLQMAGYVSADGLGIVSAADTAPSSRWKEVVARISTEQMQQDDYNTSP